MIDLISHMTRNFAIMSTAFFEIAATLIVCMEAPKNKMQKSAILYPFISVIVWLVVVVLHVLSQIGQSSLSFLLRPFSTHCASIVVDVSQRVDGFA